MCVVPQNHGPSPLEHVNHAIAVGEANLGATTQGPERCNPGMPPLDFRRNPDLPLEMLIARRMIPGVQYISKFGRNVGFDATVNPVDVWAGGGTYPGFVAAASTISLVSTSAEDGAGTNTGLSTIIVSGLGAGMIEQVETFTLTGATPVISESLWFRVFRIKGSNAGAAEANVGTITATHVDDTVVMAAILPGAGQTEQAIYTCPADRWIVIGARTLSVKRTTGTAAKSATLAWRVRSMGDTCWRTVNPIEITTDTVPLVTGQYSGMLTLDPGDDIVTRVTTASASGMTATADFDIYCFPYSGL